MGNVINSCPDNKIVLSSIKLNNPSKSCLNCSKVGYQLNSTSSACICSTGFYSNNNLCYPISCSSTGYIPNPNDNTILQIIPLPYNIDFTRAINDWNTITTTNNDSGYNILSSASDNSYNLEICNNLSSNNSVKLPFATDGSVYRNMFNSNSQYRIININGSINWYFNNGEFFCISLPYKIKLKKYKLTFLNNNFPKKFYILGTNLIINNNNSFYSTNTWYILDERNFSSIPNNKTNEYFINIFNTFSTIAIVIVSAFTNKVEINQFHLYGTYEDNSCICAPDYYLPSGTVITYDNKISGCKLKNFITFYNNNGNKLEFLYDKNIKNYFYLYRKVSDTCAMNKDKNNINFIPTGFTTNFAIASVSDITITIGALGGPGWFGGDASTCTFNNVQIISYSVNRDHVIKKSDYDFGIDLSQSFLIKYPDFQYSLYLQINNI